MAQQNYTTPALIGIALVGGYLLLKKPSIREEAKEGYLNIKFDEKGDRQALKTDRYEERTETIIERQNKNQERLKTQTEQIEIKGDIKESKLSGREDRVDIRQDNKTERTEIRQTNKTSNLKSGGSSSGFVNSIKAVVSTPSPISLVSRTLKATAPAPKTTAGKVLSVATGGLSRAIKSIFTKK